MKHERHGPDEDVDAGRIQAQCSLPCEDQRYTPHPLSDREALQREVLWVFEHEVRQVEDRAEPVVPVRDCVGQTWLKDFEMAYWLADRCADSLTGW